ncbi:pyruvate kinase [Roseospirillum parvum]|uniref:Pyruvate kinase n=1 Tax=Roseospirillum parvum TaxID=83401 RepID=A0A1G7Y604_9PROT|nr:pyruvate kinase [Roseospirillum parvum]SDG91902.1 pyruvate kinase [Roseospirillum parvum]
MRRQRYAKIIATLGPPTSGTDAIERLFLAGADVFRLNMSHGEHEDHRRRYKAIREVESRLKRPIGVLVDLQGPKMRVGRFTSGKVLLKAGARFTLDLDSRQGSESRAPLPHPEIFQAIEDGTDLLLDDGKLRLKVLAHGEDWAETEVVTGGMLSDHKGVNVPGVTLPISALTAKDREDLTFALDLGADWIALSFVQRPEDVAEARRLINGRARIISKLEKPSAITHLDDIVGLSDAVMIARGDLGVETPPEAVPILQKRITTTARRAGRPVVVATQMLESMITSPSPTRAEASDVATAVLDGADAVMLSAETAVGEYPFEAVAMMNKIIDRTEKDEHYEDVVRNRGHAPVRTSAGALSAAASQVARTIEAAAIVTFTSSGSTALRAARERPTVPILCVTTNVGTARAMALVWGLHNVHTKGEVASFHHMVIQGCEVARSEEFAPPGEQIVLIAGVPFGTPGTTNILRIARVEGEADHTPRM